MPIQRQRPKSNPEVQSTKKPQSTKRPRGQSEKPLAPQSMDHPDLPMPQPPNMPLNPQKNCPLNLTNSNMVLLTNTPALTSKLLRTKMLRVLSSAHTELTFPMDESKL